MPSNPRPERLHLCQEQAASFPTTGEDHLWEVVDRLERDIEALRDFLLSVIDAAALAAGALTTKED